MTVKMLKLGAFGILLAATMVSAQQGFLFVYMPNLMRFDSLEDVTLDYNGGSAPVPVTVSLQNYPDREKTFSIQNVMIAPRAQHKVRVMTKLIDLPAGSLATQNYVYVKVKCGPLSFSEEAVILLTDTKGHLFLQTDKPIYNPLSTVSIRAVSLNPDLLPANTNFTLDVLNPKQTIFKRFQGKAKKGFFCKKIQLPDVTSLGNWTVKAFYKSNFQSAAVTSEVAFEVKEYVLPTFSLNLKTPEFILPSFRGVQVTVRSSFVYKEEVKGRLTIVFSLSKKDGSIHTIGTPRTTSDFNGKKDVYLGKAEFGKMWFPAIGSRLVVEATVTEAASGSQESASDSSAMFVNSPYVISFADTQKYYKPGLSYTLKLLLKYASGELAADVYMNVTATAKRSGRSDRVNVFRKGFKSKEFGEIAMTLDMDSSNVDVKIFVKTNDPNIVDAEQASKEITLHPQQTSGDNFLSISVSQARLSVGDTTEVRVAFTEVVTKQVTFMVLTRGKVVSLKSISMSGSSKHEHIDITPQMSPQARLLVYYVSHGNPAEIIADSIVLDVNKTCKEELVLSHAAPNRDYRPGDNVLFKITSAPDSMVSLLGVDNAVYLLSKRDILSRDKMFKTIMDLDLGCGPGSGANATEVFRDAGLYILTSAADVPTQRRTTAECPAAISRKRRSAERVRRATRSNRIIVALNKYNDQDAQCCIDGTKQQVQQDTRTCQVIAQANGLQTVMCKNAFMSCCQMERDANTPSGRSNAENDDGEVDVDEINIEERKHFPETWIDSLLKMDNKTYNMTKPLPDSITTWVISGVSVSQDAGMCVAKPINIIAKKQFFVHVDLPYAAIRGEQLEVNATVYNFLEHKLTLVMVWMEGDLSKLCYVGKDNGRTTKMRITLEPMSGKKVTFPVVPLEVGTQDITVTATASNGNSDSVIRKLNVAAEGLVRNVYITTRLDPKGIMGDAGSGGGTVKVNFDISDKPQQTIKVPLKFPANAILGTKICSVGISGSLLGPIVPSVDMNVLNMFKQPIGCGEQTMVRMGPLVYATRYMVKTGTLGDLENITYGHILAGFENELMYKHPDGSYAVWQDTPSSAWLTAFVAKVFCQSSQFAIVSKTVSPHAVDAINWLLNNAQNANGSFREPRSVNYKWMFGQNMKNTVTFTSFVVEAISKCGDMNGVDITRGETANKLRKAVTYLERNKDTQTKPYEQAILTYALALQNSAHRFAANQKLRGMSSMDPITGMRYWRADGTVVPENATPLWYKEKPSAYAIETASYALLAQLAIGGAAEEYFQYAGPVASWLIRQRTKTGAFVSTTDTVIGLEAVTEYATRAATRLSPLNMEVRVFAGNGLDQNFQLIPANAYSPFTITKKLPIDGDLFIEAEGSGLGQVQVECRYNSPELKGEVCTFDLKVTSEEKTVPVAELNNEIEDLEQNEGAGHGGNNANEVKVFVNEIKAEFSYIGAGSQVGMSILDVTLFTGFRPIVRDLKALVEKRVIDRYEITSSSVLMYIGEVTKAKKTTVTFRSKQNQVVKDVQPAAVTIYDYYEPDQHYCTKFYNPKKGSPLLATICDKNEEGRKVCQCAASVCTEFWGFKRGQRPHLKPTPQLVHDACNIYNYAVKVLANKTGVEGAITKMEATVELNIKTGSQVYSAGDKMHFVWHSKCKNPVLTAGKSYLVMGNDGAEFVDPEGRGAMRYVLNSKSYVVEWYGLDDKPRYHLALTRFAYKLINEGCGQ